MRDWPGVRRIFRLPTSAARMRADVDAELEFHIQGRIEELVASGMSRGEAEREARARFGDFRAIESEVERLERRRSRRRTVSERIEEIMNDLRYAVRTLLRQPLFALVVIATLTLGIGATAAIFHAVDRAVLRPVPYPGADRIVYLGMRTRQGMGTMSLTARRFQFWHDNARIFESLATSRGFEAEADQAKGGLVLQGLRITPEFLAVVGATPERGRPFVADDYAAGSPPVALLSDAAWRNRFGGAAAILGSTIQLDDSRVTVVGILPPSFELAESSPAPDVFLPLTLTARQLDDGGANYTVVGKLRRGVSRAQIDDDNASVFSRFREVHPDFSYANDGGVSIVSFREAFVGPLAETLWILLAATGFVFLLACANVANVVLARTLGRQREFAIRSALGSGRGRIARQIILEMLVLGGVSAVVAVLASLAAVRGIVGLAGGGFLRSAQLQLDWRVVVLIVLVAAAATVVIGAGAALFATRLSGMGQLAASSRRDGLGGGRTLRGVLVTVESALAMVLLAGAGLLITSFNHVLAVDGGFRRDGIYTATVGHTPRTYRKLGDIVVVEQRVLDRLRATPGILDAASTATLPLTRGWNIPTTVLGHNDRTEGPTEWRAVSPDYFRLMNIPIVAGRAFTTRDVDGAPRVTVISQSYADTFFPGENPIGQHVMIGVYKGQGPDSIASEVVGIVPDLKDASLEAKRVRHTVWVPAAQATMMGASMPAFVVRSNDATAAANALRAAIAEADSRMGVPSVAAMSDVVARSVAPRRFTMILMATFAVIALALTCVGIYGVTSYAVSQRTQEIGVRIALGARPANVVRLIVRQGARPAILGLLIGLGLAAWASKAIASMLFGIGPRDPASLGAVALLLALVALVASYLPARRASRVDPVTALRSD